MAAVVQQTPITPRKRTLTQQAWNTTPAYWTGNGTGNAIYTSAASLLAQAK